MRKIIISHHQNFWLTNISYIGHLAKQQFAYIVSKVTAVVGEFLNVRGCGGWHFNHPHPVEHAHFKEANIGKPPLSIQNSEPAAN